MSFGGRDRGFTLIEIIVVAGLMVVLLATTVYSLKPASDKASTASLAKAIGSEIQNARQMAIAEGCPVAVGFSKQGSSVSQSVYRLEGWNAPRITWSVSYAGDYPSLSFAVAKWDGADFKYDDNTALMSKFVLPDSGGGLSEPVFGLFSLANWVPTGQKDDSIICFTPDGGVTSNKLPLLKGRYAVVVAENLNIGASGSVSGGTEPYAVYISKNGAVEVSKDMPGLNIGPGSLSTSSKMRPITDLSDLPKSSIMISKITTLPLKIDDLPDGVAADDVDGFCTPGEQVTFQIYAYDPQGRQLFTRWKQEGPAGASDKLGRFAFPSAKVSDGGGESKAEVERMEYLASAPDQVDFYENGKYDQAPQSPKYSGGCFYSRWTWTVPLDAKAGEEYTVTADVRDVTGNVKIAVPAIKPKVASPGRFVAEVREGNRWVLVAMNRNGDKFVRLTTNPGVEEIRPSVSGTKLAFIQKDKGASDSKKYLKIRNLDGGNEQKIIEASANYTSVSISPNGDWISYRIADGDPTATGSPGKLYIQRLDKYFKAIDENKFVRSQAFFGNSKGTGMLEPERTGWFQTDSASFAVWSNYHAGETIDTDGDGVGDTAGGAVIELARLSANGEVSAAGPSGSFTVYTVSKENQMAYSPSIFQKGEQTYLLFTMSRTNGVVETLPISELHNNNNSFGYGNAEGVGAFTDPLPKKIDLAAGVTGDMGSGNYKDGLPVISPDGGHVAVVRVQRNDSADDDEYDGKGARSVIIAKWDDGDKNFSTKSTNTNNLIRKKIRSIVWVPPR